MLETGYSKTTAAYSIVKFKQVSAIYAPMPAVRCILLFCLMMFPAVLRGFDIEEVLAGMQRKYSSVKTISGSFNLYCKEQGIEQTDTGIFWIKKPDRIHWEHQYPEEKYFIADGKELFSYVPDDNQVTIQPLTGDDLQHTPLRFLLGTEDLKKSYIITPESEYGRKIEGTQSVRLTPKDGGVNFSFLVLEIDPKSNDLQRLVLREKNGNILEYIFSDLKFDVKISDKKFEFKIPEGVEVLRLENFE